MDGGGPKMLPCALCGLLFTSGSLKFHEKSCAKKATKEKEKAEDKAGEGELTQCRFCCRTFSVSRVSVHEGICKEANKKRETFDAAKMRGFGTPLDSPQPENTWKEKRRSFYEDMETQKACLVNESGLVSDPEPDTDFVIKTVRSPLPASDHDHDDKSTLAPLFDHSVRANDFDAVLYPAEDPSEASEHKGSSYDKQSPLNTCVLVDGELAPILPAHNEHISSPAPQPVATAPAPTPSYRAPSRSTQPPSPHGTLEGPPDFLKTHTSSRSRSRSGPRSPLAPPAAGSRLLANRSRTPSAPSPSERSTPETVLLSVHRAELAKARNMHDQYKRVQDDKFNKTVEQLKQQITHVKDEANRTIQAERSRERHQTRQQRESEATSTAACKEMRIKHEESVALITKQSKELDAMRQTIKSLEQERASLRASKRQFSTELTLCKEELKQFQEKEKSTSRKRSASASPKQKDTSHVQELAKMKNELTREKTRNERLQSVLKSRKTQFQATAEMQAANLERREQQLQQDEALVKKEKERLAAQKALQERIQKELETKIKTVEADLQKLEEDQRTAFEEALRLETRNEKVMEKEKMVEARSKELEGRSREVVHDNHRQTAELKRIARERERIEAYREVLQQREDAVLERERCAGHRTHSASPVVESVVPVDVVPVDMGHINKTPTRGTPRNGRLPPPPPVPNRKPSSLTFNSTIEELEMRKAEAQLREDREETRRIERRLSALRSGVRSALGEVEVNTRAGNDMQSKHSKPSIESVERVQPIEHLHKNSNNVVSPPPPSTTGTARQRRTTTPSSSMSTARQSSRSQSSLSTGVSAHTKPQDPSQPDPSVVARIIKNDLASKSCSRPSPSPDSSVTDTTLTLSELHIPHAPYHPIPVTSINLI